MAQTFAKATLPAAAPHEIRPWWRIAMARENLLSAMEDGLYDVDFIGRRIVSKHFFHCNSPEAIQAAFGAGAATSRNGTGCSTSASTADYQRARSRAISILW